MSGMINWQISYGSWYTKKVLPKDIVTKRALTLNNTDLECQVSQNSKFANTNALNCYLCENFDHYFFSDLGYIQTNGSIC